MVDNLFVGLKYRGVSRRECRQRIEDVLTTYGLNYWLGDLLPSSPAAAQKVALARIMVFDPQVLLLDEPTVNLDPHNAFEFEQEIADIHGQQGKTIEPGDA